MTRLVSCSLLHPPIRPTEPEILIFAQKGEYGAREGVQAGGVEHEARHYALEGACKTSASWGDVGYINEIPPIDT